MKSGISVFVIGGLLILALGLIDLVTNAYNLHSNPITFDNGDVMSTLFFCNIKGMAACFLSIILFKWKEAARIPVLAISLTAFTVTLLWFDASAYSLSSEHSLTYSATLFLVLPTMAIVTLVLASPELFLFLGLKSKLPAKAVADAYNKPLQHARISAEKYRKTGTE